MDLAASSVAPDPAKQSSTGGMVGRWEIRSAWRIIDVIVESSISELAVRRSEYARILRQGGTGELIGVLDGKTEDALRPGD